MLVTRFHPKVARWLGDGTTGCRKNGFDVATQNAGVVRTLPRSLLAGRVANSSATVVLANLGCGLVEQLLQLPMPSFNGGWSRAVPRVAEKGRKAEQAGGIGLALCGDHPVSLRLPPLLLRGKPLAGGEFAHFGSPQIPFLRGTLGPEVGGVANRRFDGVVPRGAQSGWVCGKPTPTAGIVVAILVCSVRCLSRYLAVCVE